jgi:hypothetical protein
MKNHYDLTEDNTSDTKAMGTTKRTHYQTTMVDASKTIPQSISNGALKITTTTPSTRNSAPKGADVAGTGKGRTKLSLGVN